MQKVSQFIDGTLNTHHRQLKYATRKLHNVLPCQLIPHVGVASYTEKAVTLSASNQGIAQKLRYCTRDIKKSLGVQHVAILISNANIAKRAPAPKTARRPIGREAQALLTETAATISHKGIQHALTKLAKASQNS